MRAHVAPPNAARGIPPDRFVLRECARTVRPVSLVTHMHWSEGWRILRFEDGWREVGRRELELGPKPRIAARSQFRICLRDPAARCARGFVFISRPLEGVGNAGCPLHPRPRVHLVVVERTRVTTSTPESPDVPARNGFNGFLRALPGEPGLFATITCGYVLSKPGWADATPQT